MSQKTERMRESFVKMYGEIGDSLDEDTWMSWFGIYASGWADANCDAQSQVAQNTNDRGYRNGWTNEQFAARQVCKAVEELAELAGCIGLDKNHEWRGILFYAGMKARKAFDNRRIWDIANVDDEHAPDEAADVLVTLFNFADAMGFDLVQKAIDKSAADVERGVR